MFPRPALALLISLVFCFTLAFVGFQKQIKTLIPSDSRAFLPPSTSYLRDVLPEESTAVITSVSDELISSSIKDEFDKINNKLDMIYDLLKVQNYKSDNITSSLTLVENTVRESELIVNSAQNNNDNSPSMKRALECLRQTKPELPDLSYPKDAFQHFQEIHQRLDKWAQHADHKPHRAAAYKGPWIENIWISHFQKELQSKNNSLSDVFGPYIPIFIPWTDIWVSSHWKYPKDLALEMMKEDLLRDDVMYITVNQNDDGFVGRCSEFSDLQSKYHITVLSAGGYGHVPIPLLKQPEPSLSKVPLSERKHLISYVGSKKNAPEHMRQKMISQGNHYYYGKKWRDEMAQSKFQLCPRGFGRTSYHIQETLQMGLIPIQVYLDQPWLPYGNLMKNLSYSVTVEKLPELVLELSKISDSQISKIEHKIEKLRNDYFSFEGAIKQIGKFMFGVDEMDSGELVCQALPDNSGSGHTSIDSCSS